MGEDTRTRKASKVYSCLCIRFFTRILSTMNYAKIKLKNTGQDV
jgi:hypothetical protein